jgi:hypothetical protein
MTDNELRMMRKILVQKRDEIDCCSEQDLNVLLGSIDSELYNNQFKAFYKYFKEALPADNACGDAEWDAFYETDFKIAFGDKSVTIHNDVYIYEAIRDALAYYAEHYL